LKHNLDSSAPPQAVAEASPLLLWTVGASIAILVTNLYFAQSLIAVIAPDLGIQPQFAGTVVSASQFGYGLGLFLLVPLSDRVENRRLVLICGLLAILGTLGLATATSAIVFLCCAFFTGVFSSGAQVLVPYLSHALPVSR
jgi:predicted MFS family arabinose efflux permease